MTRDELISLIAGARERGKASCFISSYPPREIADVILAKCKCIGQDRFAVRVGDLLVSTPTGVSDSYLLVVKLNEPCLSVSQTKHHEWATRLEEIARGMREQSERDEV